VGGRPRALVVDATVITTPKVPRLSMGAPGLAGARWCWRFNRLATRGTRDLLGRFCARCLVRIVDRCDAVTEVYCGRRSAHRRLRTVFRAICRAVRASRGRPWWNRFFVERVDELDESLRGGLHDGM